MKLRMWTERQRHSVNHTCCQYKLYFNACGPTFVVHKCTNVPAAASNTYCDNRLHSPRYAEVIAISRSVCCKPFLERFFPPKFVFANLYRIHCNWYL